jgi:protein-arginine kinase activator protein McsA
MAQYTYEQLRDMTVAQLRDIAKDVESEEIKGYSTMHKDHLLPALCKVFGIHIHHAAAGAQKTRMKANIAKLKARLAEAAAKKDYAQAARARRQIHKLKHQLRTMAVRADMAAAHAPGAKAEKKE